MTVSQPNSRPENVLGGALLALLAIPVGVVVLALLSSIGFVASIVGFLVAFAAVWLYRSGSGGRISRTGAWIVTGVVVVTLLVGIWADLVVTFADGLGHLGNIGLDGFWPQFSTRFPSLVSEDVLFIVLVLAFGALGSFRVLRRAFAIASAPSHPGTTAGSSSSTSAPTAYRNDLDTPPTGSSDDKAAPPTAGN